MSESEEDYDSSGYETGSTAGDTYMSFAAALEAMSEYLEEFGEEIDTVHSAMQTMEGPVTSVAISSFVQPRILESSTFRNERFRLKEKAQHLFEIRHTTIIFGSLCSHIRKYLFKNNLVDTKGLVTLNKDLQDLFETTETSVTFLWILTHLNSLIE